jgi:NIMA (never in mitosis gene a)-related kinase 1/4/5
LIQLLCGLKALHDLKVMHRDIKTANILVSNSGAVKLADFNVSKVVKNDGLLKTQTGTPYYASPEVW